MKSQIVKIMAISLMMVCGTSYAQKPDPALTAAVIAQTSTLKELHKETINKQEKIELLNTGIMVEMGNIHAIEKKVVEYLSEASGTIKNAYQLIKATQLSTDIIKHLQECLKAAKAHPINTAMSAMLQNKYTEIYTEAASTYAYMATLVTTGTVNGTKVNLLSSAERMQIMAMVMTKLQNIDYAILSLTVMLESYGLLDWWREIDQEGWSYIVNADLIAKQIIQSWNYMKLQ